jgi:hypothetical protein
MGDTHPTDTRQSVTSADLGVALQKQSEMLTRAISGREAGLSSRGVDPSAMTSDQFIAELGSYAYGLAQASFAAIKSAESAVDTSGSRLDRLLWRSEGLLADKTTVQTSAEVIASALASVYISRLKELRARKIHDEPMSIVKSYREVAALRDLVRKYLPEETVEQHKAREFWVEELDSTAGWLEYGAEQCLDTAKVISEEVRERTEEAQMVCRGKASRKKLEEMETRTLEDLRSELEAFCLVTEVGRAQEAARLKAAAASRTSVPCLEDRSHFGVDDDDDDDDVANAEEPLQHLHHSLEVPRAAFQDALKRAESVRTIWEPSPSAVEDGESRWVTVLRKSASPSFRRAMILSRGRVWDRESNEPRHARYIATSRLAGTDSRVGHCRPIHTSRRFPSCGGPHI